MCPPFGTGHQNVFVVDVLFDAAITFVLLLDTKINIIAIITNTEQRFFLFSIFNFPLLIIFYPSIVNIVILYYVELFVNTIFIVYIYFRTIKKTYSKYFFHNVYRASFIFIYNIPSDIYSAATTFPATADAAAVFGDPR